MIGEILKSAREVVRRRLAGYEDDQDDQTGSMVMETGRTRFRASHCGPWRAWDREDGDRRSGTWPG